MPANATPSRPRLGSIGIANFKAFGPHLQTIPLRPITLIFGPNSGGKSSLLHFFLWLNDVTKNRKLDVYFPIAAGEEVDLGGFKQVRHGNDATSQVQIRMTLAVLDARKQPRELEITSYLGTSQPSTDYAARLRELVRERFQESRSRNSMETLLKNLETLAQNTIRETLTKLLAEEHGEGRLLLRLSDCFEGKGEYTRPLQELCETASPNLRQAISNARKLLLADLMGLLDEDADSKIKEDPTPLPAQSAPSLTEDELLAELQSLACAVLEELDHKTPQTPEDVPLLMRFELREQGDLVLAAGRNEARQLVVRHADFAWLAAFTGSPSANHQAWMAAWNAAPGSLVFDDAASWLPRKMRRADIPHEALCDLALVIEGSKDARGLLEDCEAAAREACGPLAYLAPVRAIPPRNMNVAELPREHDAKGWHAWRRLYEDDALRGRVSKWLQSEGVCADYDIDIDHCVGLTRASTSIRRHFDECYSRFDAETRAIKDLDRTGDQAGSAFASLHADRAWNAEAYLDAGTMVKDALAVTAASLKSESAGTVILRDRRSGKEVSCKDVGIGISQMIPVLVRAMDARDEITVMEQPEIHLHPKLQAELGDVFIESALNRGNTFVLETHSEHLILRIMRRMRETVSGTLPEGLPPLRKEDVAVLFVEPTPEGSIVREMPLNDRGDLVKAWPGGFFEEGFNEMF